MNKICTKCNTNKELCEFSPTKGGRFGVDSICKMCRNALAKIRYDSDPNKFREKTKAYTEAHKDCHIFKAKKLEADRTYYRKKSEDEAWVIKKRQSQKIFRTSPEQKLKSRLYRLEISDKSKEYFKKRYEEKKSEMLADQKLRYEANKESILEKNKEYQKLYTKTYRYKKLKTAREAKRRFLKKQATPKWADLEAIKEFYLNCPKGYEVDPIVPLNGIIVTGFHVLNNLQYLSAKENRSKSNKVLEAKVG